MKNSINDISNNINKCTNLTYITFSKKYEALSKEEEINSMIDTNLSKISNSIIIENQNKITKVNYIISQISKKVQVKCKIEYEEEGRIKKPKVNVSIINESRPKQIEFKFINPQIKNGDIITLINFEPNNVNFTTNVFYSTKSKDIYITTVTDFESYKYCTELLQLQENVIESCEWIDGIYICIQFYDYTEDSPKILSSKKCKIVPRKKIIEESIVHENNIFKE